MKVPLLDLGPQMAPLAAEIKAAVNEVIDSTQYILGPKVEAFEAEVASYLGTAHGVGVSSGTDALLVALMALEVGPGDLVLTTPYTFFATAGAVTRVGAVPVFIDIDPETYNMCPRALSAWCGEHPREVELVKAILPVHLYGQCAEMGAVLALAERHGIPIIEDGAQAIGASYPGADGVRKAGALGDLGCFSFFPSKNLGGIGDAGLVTMGDPELAARVRQLRMHGENPRYHHAFIGGNFRIDPIQCVALSVKLRHLEEWHEMRRRNAAFYDAGLSDVPVKTPVARYGREHHIYNQYVIAVESDRDGLRAHLTEAGIGNNVYYPVPLHLQECFAYLGYEAGDLPNAEHAAEHTVALPVYPEMTEEMLGYVVEVIRGYYGG